MNGKQKWLFSVIVSALLAGSVGVGCSPSKNQDVAPVEQENGEGNEAADEGEEDESVVTKEDEQAPGESIRSSMSRELSPQVSETDAEKLSQDNRDFAFALYQQLLAENSDDNLFLSPHSISSALAMTYGGARDETATEIAEAMHFKLEQTTLHPAFNALDLELESRSKAEVPEGAGEPFELNVVNAIWGENDHRFAKDYLDLLAKNYGAGLHKMDFTGQAEASREAINVWVEKQTKERVKDLLPQGAISSDTRLVLTNAIYFKAGWLNEFHESSTKNAPFHLLDGKATDVKQMRQMAHFPYAAGEDYQMIELPYVGNQVAMAVVLPAEGKFAEFESALTGEKFGELVGKLDTKNGTIQLPQFSFESSYSLAEPLSKLGMEQAFTRQADFSGIDGSKDLSISAIVHKAFVAVDEEGTEAAAATAVSIGTTSMPIVDFEMTVDRPFLFVIYDKPTQAVLFVGRVVDPS